MVKENIGSAGLKYFPFLFSLFLLLAVLNLVGIVPYTFTPSAHIAIGLGFSFSL
jgi:F0F1-type ATP synthase membrane subunit a